MTRRKFIVLFFVLALAQSTIGNVAITTDWPQWQGPNRTGLSTETGLLKAWPEAGPKVAWSITGIGAGYGSLAIKGESVLVQGTKGTDSVVYALDRASGKTVWTRTLGPMVKEGRGHGPRGTPTIDGNNVYVLSENGDLACLKFSDGSIIWQRNILKDFGAATFVGSSANRRSWMAIT